MFILTTPYTPPHTHTHTCTHAHTYTQCLTECAIAHEFAELAEELKFGNSRFTCDIEPEHCHHDNETEHRHDDDHHDDDHHGNETEHGHDDDHHDDDHHDDDHHDDDHHGNETEEEHDHHEGKNCSLVLGLLWVQFLITQKGKALGSLSHECIIHVSSSSKERN